MEEQQTIQIITILIRSNEVQELRMDIYDSFDTLITNFNIHNYQTHTIHLKKSLTRFYCIAINHQHHIEEQFQVKFHQGEPNKSPFQFCKKFKGFSVKIQIEEKKSLQKVLVFQKFIKEQTQLSKFANNHLRKLENTVFKKIQVEQLKKPLPQKYTGDKSSSMRKLKKTLTFKKLAKDHQKRYLANKVKNLQLTLKSLTKPKFKGSQQSQRSDQSLMISTIPAALSTNRKKHNTLFEQNQIHRTQISTKQLNQQQKQSDDYYHQFIKALQCTSNQNQTKRRKIQKIRRSHNQLEISTMLEIERQKKAFQVVKTMKGLYSQQSSPVKIINSPRNSNQKKASPYTILSSTAFLKRKVI